MSTSSARLEANRLNAQKSTGPRTEEGRARSAQNARTHGLTASTLPPSARSNERFQALAAALRDMFAPVDIIEEDIVDRILLARWNLLVAKRMIAGYVDLAEDPDWADPEADPERARTRHLAWFFMSDAGSNCFSKMLRYRDSSQRQFDRLRKELEALRETNPIEEQPVTLQAVAASASIVATPPPSAPPPAPRPCTPPHREPISCVG
jgi:hypothetical protein